MSSLFYSLILTPTVKQNSVENCLSELNPALLFGQANIGQGTGQYDGILDKNSFKQLKINIATPNSSGYLLKLDTIDLLNGISHSDQDPSEIDTSIVDKKEGELYGSVKGLPVKFQKVYFYSQDSAGVWGKYYTYSLVSDPVFVSATRCDEDVDPENIKAEQDSAVVKKWSEFQSGDGFIKPDISLGGCGDAVKQIYDLLSSKNQTSIITKIEVQNKALFIHKLDFACNNGVLTVTEDDGSSTTPISLCCEDEEGYGI